MSVQFLYEKRRPLVLCGCGEEVSIVRWSVEILAVAGYAEAGFSGQLGSLLGNAHFRTTEPDRTTTQPCERHLAELEL